MSTTSANGTAAGAQAIVVGAEGLIVPDRPIVPFIRGDGVGPDVWRAAEMVLDAAVDQAFHGDRAIAWMEVYAGSEAFRRTGSWLPDETVGALREHLVGMRGPLEVPTDGQIRSLNVAVRESLDLYACVRPVRYLAGMPSPLRQPESVDVVIFRESTEDVYASVEYVAGSAEARRLVEFLRQEHPDDFDRMPFAVDHAEAIGVGVKPVSRPGTERLVRAAIRYALDHGRKSVTLVHKGNIMKFTEGAFRDWGYTLAEKEFGDRVHTRLQWGRTARDKGADAADAEWDAAERGGKLIIKDVIADNALQQLLTQDEHLDVIATLNLNGDYLSNALAAEMGGVDSAPSGNMNFETGHAVFEASHGPMPEDAGKDCANPCSVILSGAMMLEYLGWHEAARLVGQGLERTMQERRVPSAFAPLSEGSTALSTSDFAAATVENMAD